MDTMIMIRLIFFFFFIALHLGPWESGTWCNFLELPGKRLPSFAWGMRDTAVERSLDLSLIQPSAVSHTAWIGQACCSPANKALPRITRLKVIQSRPNHVECNSDELIALLNKFKEAMCPSCIWGFVFCKVLDRIALNGENNLSCCHLHASLNFLPNKLHVYTYTFKHTLAIQHSSVMAQSVPANQ